MYGPLALILVAAGVFLGLVVQTRGRRDHGDEPDEGLDQVRGFAIVGAGAAIALGAVVLIIGLSSAADGLAETLGLLAVFGFLLYLIVATVVIMILRRPAPQPRPPSEDRRWGPPAGSAPAQQPADRDAGRDRPGEPADHRRTDQS